MVRTFMFSILAIGEIVMADQMTNALALVGIPLGNVEIAQLPQQDDSSPDTLFLGVARALAVGNIGDLYSHFDANYFTSLTGYACLQDIPATAVSSFEATMHDSNLSNIVIMAYSTSTSNQFLRIDAILQENFTSRSLTEPLELTIEQQSANWKIVSYDDDNWDD